MLYVKLLNLKLSFKFEVYFNIGGFAEERHWVGMDEQGKNKDCFALNRQWFTECFH